jgi:phage terminase Nu1 subunit (DNA packaging protein)
MLPTTLTTKELCKLTGYSKPALHDLESSGTVSRAAKDSWPLDTVGKIIAHLRARPSHGDARRRLEELKVQREQLRARREASELCRTADFDAAIDMLGGSVLRHLGPLPARLAPHDLALRRAIEAELRAAQLAMADDFKAEADKLGGGKSDKAA